MAGEGASDVISQLAAASCIHDPVIDSRLAAQIARNTGWRSGAQKEDRACVAESVVVVIHASLRVTFPLIKREPFLCQGKYDLPKGYLDRIGFNLWGCRLDRLRLGQPAVGWAAWPVIPRFEAENYR